MANDKSTRTKAEIDADDEAAIAVVVKEILTCPESVLDSLWRGVEDNPEDWGRWRVLEDAHLDIGDEVGAGYCRFMRTKERVYVYPYRGTANVHLNDVVALHVLSAKRSRLTDVWERAAAEIDMRQAREGSGSVHELHVLYLAAWRTLSDEQRGEALACGPT